MKMVREIELRSDTMTRPNIEMRKAMFNAVVGDDGYGEDPTVKELEELGAQLLGKESALFFPTGCMGNLASVMSHCWERGAEAILGDMSHIAVYEQGGIAQIANVHTRTLKNCPDGTFSIAELESRIRAHSLTDVHVPRTALICVENTHNLCYGSVVPLSFMDDVNRVACSKNLKVHLDGARVWNAAVALGVPVHDVVAKADSVSVCLSKGLGCPAGNLVAGSKELIAKAIRCRKVLGGSMRQSGVLAATGIVALNSMVQRLEEDHNHARMLAQAVSSMKSEIVSVDVKRVQSNIVYLNIDSDAMSVSQFCDRMRKITDEEKAELGDEAVVVRMNPLGEWVRMVTHVDVSLEDTQLTIKKLHYVINELEKEVPITGDPAVILICLVLDVDPSVLVMPVTCYANNTRRRNPCSDHAICSAVSLQIGSLPRPHPPNPRSYTRSRHLFLPPFHLPLHVHHVFTASTTHENSIPCPFVQSISKCVTVRLRYTSRRSSFTQSFNFLSFFLTWDVDSEKKIYFTCMMNMANERQAVYEREKRINFTGLPAHRGTRAGNESTYHVLMIFEKDPRLPSCGCVM